MHFSQHILHCNCIIRDCVRFISALIIWFIYKINFYFCTHVVIRLCAIVCSDYVKVRNALCLYGKYSNLCCAFRIKQVGPLWFLVLKYDQFLSQRDLLLTYKFFPVWVHCGLGQFPYGVWLHDWCFANSIGKLPLWMST